MLTILVAEDNRAERLLLADILKSAGYKVVLAENAAETLTAYHQNTIDIVLLDVLLGEENGRDIALAIRAAQQDTFIPVVFITGLSLSEDIIECLKVGDDVIQKPFHEEILLSKILALSRIRQLYSKIKEQRDEINFHRNAILREQELAKKIYDRIAYHGALESSSIRYYLSPQAFFNGDVILAAHHPLGGLVFFVGDFTGHGLPAALGALPIAEIFYSMTKRGHNISQILRAMNKKLHLILPSEVFCAAIMLYVNEKDGFVQAWNGGLPAGRICYQNKKDEFIASKHLPLGILDDSKFHSDPDYIEISAGDHIFLFSDGVYDAYGEETTQETRKTINQIFEERDSAKTIFKKIIDTILLKKGNAQCDDMTLVDIEVTAFQNEGAAVEAYAKKKNEAIDWVLRVCLGPNSLRFFDPLPILLQVISDVPPLRAHASQIYTILSEMYSNALDHGILRLNSDIKNSSAGFHEYYEKRKRALLNLKEGSIELEISFLDKGPERYLRIFMKDSGSGFNDYNKTATEKMYGGRGIALLRKLCAELSYYNDGRECEALYRWR